MKAVEEERIAAKKKREEERIAAEKKAQEAEAKEAAKALEEEARKNQEAKTSEKDKVRPKGILCVSLYSPPMMLNLPTFRAGDCRIEKVCTSCASRFDFMRDDN